MKLFKGLCDYFISLKKDSSHDRHEATEKEATRVSQERAKRKDRKYIICNGTPVEIKWGQVSTFEDANSLVLPTNCYKSSKNERKPQMLMAHWDVCLSSQICFNVLKKRKLSVHFLIDNDGTIHQIMDTNDIGYHAGNRKVNNASIGVEISNAFYPRYQSVYQHKGYGPRPLQEGVIVHGRTLEDHLGFYPHQIEAFKALAETLHAHYDIPLQAPMNGDTMSTTVDPKAKQGKFHGVLSHFHVSPRKIDCGGLDLHKLFEEPVVEETTEDPAPLTLNEA
jgi:N-acetyl-anhydromuramyl-L-alanine amidase AmpD